MRFDKKKMRGVNGFYIHTRYVFASMCGLNDKAWIANDVPLLFWDVITAPCPNFHNISKKTAVELEAMMSCNIPLFKWIVLLILIYHAK